MIVAKYIDPCTIAYECENCWTKYKKNGEPYKRAKKVICFNTFMVLETQHEVYLY